MNKRLLVMLWTCVLAGALAGCSHPKSAKPTADAARAAAEQAILRLGNHYAPDKHLAIFDVGLQAMNRRLVLTGEVDSAEARLDLLRAMERAGVRAEDRITLLPAAELGDSVWGISCLSVANARELPEHKAELGTQALMGQVVQLWKRTTNGWLEWFYASTADGYHAWLEAGTFLRCTRAEAEAWNRSPLLIVTADEDRILAAPEPTAEPVSDVVKANLLKNLDHTGEWFHVALPDGRSGYLPDKSATNYTAWKLSRTASARNIESTARSFLGRPYLWGGNSPKGLDCSGFTKLVYYLNGVSLDRNASHQSRQGAEVPLDPTRSRLKKGDLLFFGRPPRDGNPEKIVHVGIYLGDGLFIHSSERVRISSLDPGSPLRDERRIRTLLHARRVLSF